LHGIVDRKITDKLQATIAQAYAVVSLGARRVGKTMLAKTLSEDIDSIYLDLEAPKELLKLSDPTSFLVLMPMSWLFWVKFSEARNCFRYCGD
jgi:predicted AAA+ superfamily ATPase